MAESKTKQNGFSLWRIEEVERLKKKLANAQDDTSKNQLRYINDLVEGSPNRKLAPTIDTGKIARLRGAFPNFATAIDEVARAAALARMTEGQPFWMPPMLLLGDPGLGKTLFAKSLARMLGLPVNEVDMGSNSAGFVLSGLDLGWSTGRPGLVYNTLVLEPYANPFIILDEVDKIGVEQKHPPTGALLSLLESSTASRFRDEAVPVPLDARQINWIATANDVESIQKPLLSRFTVIEIPALTKAQMPAIVCSVYRVVREGFEWGKQFPEQPDDIVIHLLSDMPPREMRRILLRAFGNAAMVQRNHLHKDDFLSATAPSTKPRIGFIG